jgi:glucose/mannose transport system substrate-binding protein
MKTPLRLRSLQWLALPLVLASTGCASSSDDEGEVRFDLQTWWSQKSELDAIDAVIAVNQERHPNVHIRVLNSDSQGALQLDVKRGLAEGTPPTAFQANLGGNALQWRDSALPINQRAKAWSSAFQDSILERVTADGALLGVPLALTRQNNAYYNLKLLSQLHLEIPQGRDELDTWLAALAAKGYTHPLCLGDAFNWVSAHVLFEDIVPAYIGAEHAREFWSGQLSADDPLFAEALDYAATLNPYWNTDFDKIDWDKGLGRLLEETADPTEQCFMTPMGDWGGAVLSGDFVVDEDFAQRSWPGAEKLFVLAGDTFVTTRGVKNEDAALDFFDTLASEAGQIAFNTKKGSVPARTLSDEQRSKFSPLTRANMADLAAGKALPAFKVLGSSEFPWDDLAKLTHDFLLVGDKQPIIDFIADNYGKLAP